MPAERRLSELTERYALTPATQDALQKLLHVVATDPAAPTTITKPGEAVDVHVADSLSGLEIDAIRQAQTIADLGAGAGFPGLVLAAALPTATVTEVESVGKKVAFMRCAIEAANLTNATAIHARAEAWEDGIGACDVVTARAVADLAVLVEYAAPLLKPAGVFVAWKGRRDDGEERRGEDAAAQLGLELVEIRRVHPFHEAEARHLHLYSKVRPTPPNFPRRAGMARKRPLRGST